MVLSAQSIRKRGILTPFFERHVHLETGASWGLSVAGYDIRVKQGIELGPNEFTLASSIEHFDMPNDLLGVVADKSSLARRGIAVQNTIIEAGWRGHLTLEITNHSRDTVHLIAGQPIAQIIFHQLDEPTETPYGGKYQDQPDMPVEAKRETWRDQQDWWREEHGTPITPEDFALKS